MKSLTYLTQLEQAVKHLGREKISIRQRLGRCGRKECRKCPNGGFHGVYHYAKWREKGAYKELYLGKVVPKGFEDLMNKRKKKKDKQNGKN